jgi:hypothetical protein
MKFHPIVKFLLTALIMRYVGMFVETLIKSK